MTRKVFQTFLVLLLFFAHVPFGQAEVRFKDVQLYNEEINYLTDLGIIKGYSSDIFQPEAPIKRLQAVQMILREMGAENVNGAPNPNFTDMKPGDYGYEDVAKAVQLGFISGKTNAAGKKYFDPWGTLTRGQMAKILASAYDIQGSYSLEFTDVKKESHWAYHFVSAIAANNVTTGYQDGSFKPENKISRQHFAVFMARYLNERFKPAPELQGHFIYVGQGDATLFITPSGKTMLIDAGKASEVDGLICYLKEKRVTTIDILAATHPDADHIGGIERVLNEFEVKQILDSGQPHTSETYLRYLQKADLKNIPFRVPQIGEYIELDPALDIQVLNNGEEEPEDNNDASLAFKISHSDVDFMLTGDASSPIEEKIMARFDVSADIYKVAHHGSDTSSGQEFLNSMHPGAAIISAGIDNPYGHPHSSVLSRLDRAGVFSTWELGGENVVVTSNGETYGMSSSYSSCNNPYGDIDEEEGGWPEPEPNPAPVTGKLDIINLDLDKEIVTIRNADTKDILMDQWKMISLDGNQLFEFPSNFTLKKGASVTITSGRNAFENRPAYLLWTSAYMWDNNGDTAQLLNPQGGIVDVLAR
jgi:competence protein ComEC